MYNLDTPLWQLTVGEFLELQERAMKPLRETEEKPAQGGGEKRLVYGIRGLARLLDCSHTTAQKVKNSGVIDRAVTQFGRKLIIDADLAISLMAGGGGRPGRKKP